MLFIAKEQVEDKTFLRLLNSARERALADITNGYRPHDGLEFQDFIFDSMCTVAKATEFEGSIKQSGAHSFPDIIAKQYFGVEVKMASSDKWTSLGNSILESTRAEDVKKIYMLFGRFGQSADIRYRRYQDCLKDIAVTHSPRYLIDMELPEGESIFSKIGIDYDTLRQNKNPITTIKEFYRSQLKDGEELWWIDSPSDRATSPIIRPFRSLTSEDKQCFVIESMILFPEIFGKSTVKFERAAAYLMTKYGCVSASLRDAFTAGGTAVIKMHGTLLTVPQIFGKMYDFAPLIVEAIYQISDSDLRYFWRNSKIGSDRLIVWKKLLSKATKNILPSIDSIEIFEAGVENSRK